MIVASNTSPITNLAAIGQFGLLRLLYPQVYIAQAVWEELHASGREWPGTRDVAEADWIKRSRVRNRSLVVSLQRDLDRGEAETIALALEKKADLVLLDEKEGRRAAVRLGLRVTGVVGYCHWTPKHNLTCTSCSRCLTGCVLRPDSTSTTICTARH